MNSLIKINRKELTGIILNDFSIEKSLIELNFTKNITNLLRFFLYNETVPGTFDDYKIYSKYYKIYVGLKAIWKILFLCVRKKIILFTI